MRNLSKVLGVAIVMILMLIGNVANAQTEIIIDSTYNDADLTLSVGDTLFEYIGSDYEFYGIVGENYGDSINIEYVVITDHTEYFWYGNSTTEGEVYDWTDKVMVGYPNYRYTYNYSDFTLPIDGSVSDFVVGFENDNDEYFTLNLTFNHSSTSVSNINTVNNAIILYPNPVVNTLNISGEFKKAVVFNTNGKMLIETESSSIDMSKMEKGVYFVKLISESGVSTQKVVLE